MTCQAPLQHFPWELLPQPAMNFVRTQPTVMDGPLSTLSKGVKQPTYVGSRLEVLVEFHWLPQDAALHDEQWPLSAVEDVHAVLQGLIPTR